MFPTCSPNSFVNPRSQARGSSGVRMKKLQPLVALQGVDWALLSKVQDPPPAAAGSRKMLRARTDKGQSTKGLTSYYCNSQSMHRRSCVRM